MRVNLLADRGSGDGSPRPTLGEWLDHWSGKRGDVKPATMIFYGNVLRNLRADFGQTRTLDSISAGDADDFRLYLIDQKLADGPPAAGRCQDDLPLGGPPTADRRKPIRGRGASRSSPSFVLRSWKCSSKPSRASRTSLRATATPGRISGRRSPKSSGGPG
ncbi:MAG: hypothetical protein U1D55_15715 [Phycisphaerae bacterium]